MRRVARYIRRFGAISMGLIGCLVLATSASSTSDAWAVQEETPTLIETGTYASEDELRAQLGMHAQTDCTQISFSIGSTGQNYSECLYSSAFGAHSRYGNYFVPSGSSIGGLVGIDAQTRFIPLYGNTNLLVLRPSIDGGFSMHLYRYGTFTIDPIHTDTNDVQLHFYDIVTEPNLTIMDESAPLVVDENLLATGFWFSNNGRYLVLANYSGGILRIIDLDTYQVQEFPYAESENSYGNFAISNNGRWLTRNIHGEQLQLLDVASCHQENIGTRIRLSLCQLGNLAHPIAERLPNSGGTVYWATFTEDHIIELYSAAYTSDGGYAKFLLYAPGTYQYGTNYLALGDSYASGEGAGSYYAGTDVDVNRCHLSRVSYPFLLGAQLGLDSARSVACSGARIVNITGPEKISDDENDLERSNQATTNQQDIDLGNMTPGWRIQTSSLVNAPDIVTVSIAGNDAQFANFISECALAGTCFADEAERMSLVRAIQQQYDRLVALYGELRATLAADSRIYALGYPQLLSDSASCSFNSLMDHRERTLTRNLTNYLNYVIKQAARQAGITYVDLSEALAGHRLCDQTNTSAMHGLNVGLSSAHQQYLLSRESFHPTAFGHQLLAQTIREQTNNFTTLNPLPLYTTPPSLADAGYFGVVDQAIAEHYIDALYYASYYDGQIILRGDRTQGLIGGNRYIDLAPDSPFTIQLYSMPQTLGTFYSDSAGVLSYDVTIPADVTPGFHRIRIFGTDRSGRPIEVRQLVYIGVSNDDLDGDGIANTMEPCTITIENDAGDFIDTWCTNPTSTMPTLEAAEQSATRSATTSQPNTEPTIPDLSQQIGHRQSAVLSVESSLEDSQEPPIEKFAITARAEENIDIPRNHTPGHITVLALAVAALVLVCYWYMRKRIGTS